MKKKFLYSTAVILACIIISVLIETLGFNFKAISNNGQAIENINFVESENEDNKTVNLKIEHKYINKIIINYHTDKDIEYFFKYTAPDSFGGTKEVILEDIFDDSFSKAVININEDISNVTIEYANTKNSNLNLEGIASDNGFHFNFTRTFFIFLSLILISSLFYFYKSGFKTEKLHIYFFIVSSLLGAMFIVAQPSATFYSYDDQIHFQNTIDLLSTGPLTYSVGEYHSANTNVSNSAGHNSINSIEEQQSQNDLFNSGESDYSKDVSFAPTYNKIGYLPMSIGYHLAKLVKLPFSACFKIGKIFNLLFYVLMMAYAIKTIKIGKRLLSVIALIPTNIFLASEYSYDPAVIIGLTIFVSHLVNLYLDKNTKFNFKTAIIILTSISYACFVKAIYVPFLLLTLLIPKDRFDNQKQSRLVKGGIIGVAILLSATFILPTISGTMESDSRGGSTSVSGQLSSVIAHPLDYAKLLGNTAVAQFSDKTLDSFNNYAYISNKATASSTNFLYIIPILLLFVFLTDNKNNSLTKKQRLAILAASLTTILSVWTALYLTFTPVGSNTINGVQSRYFLPLFLPLLLCLQFKNIHITIKPKTYNAAIIAIPAIVNMAMIIMSILAIYAY